MSGEHMLRIIRQRGIVDARVLAAMAQVPRHEFVPAAERTAAYGDFAMPIGYRQTISQPYIVALMTEALALNPGEKVLEIGTGSGYQSAVLAAMGLEVYSVERILGLYETAKASLDRLGYRVHMRLGDGYEGWPEFAPYDGIIVTAAPTHLPQPLVQQLGDGGRLVIPLGPEHGYQTLWQFTKHGDELERRDLGGVAFVPFVHDADS